MGEILQCTRTVRKKLNPKDKIAKLAKCGAMANEFIIRGASFETRAILCYKHADGARREGFKLEEVKPS